MSAATTRGSNCVPLQRSSSSSASAAAPPATVRAVAEHRLEGVGDGDDPRLDRDRLAAQPERVAVTVERSWWARTRHAGRRGRDALSSRAPISGWVRISVHSSSVSGPSSNRIESATPILPMSCSTPASRMRSVRSDPRSRARAPSPRRSGRRSRSGGRCARRAGRAPRRAISSVVRFAAPAGVARGAGGERADDLAAVDHRAVAAEGLGGVERLVGAAQQPLGRSPSFGIRGDRRSSSSAPGGAPRPPRAPGGAAARPRRRRRASRRSADQRARTPRRRSGRRSRSGGRDCAARCRPPPGRRRPSGVRSCR